MNEIIPIDVIHIILSLIPFEDVRKCALVCKKFQSSADVCTLAYHEKYLSSLKGKKEDKITIFQAIGKLRSKKSRDRGFFEFVLKNNHHKALEEILKDGRFFKFDDEDSDDSDDEDYSDDAKIENRADDEFITYKETLKLAIRHCDFESFRSIFNLKRYGFNLRAKDVICEAVDLNIDTKIFQILVKNCYNLTENPQFIEILSKSKQTDKVLACLKSIDEEKEKENSWIDWSIVV